MSSKPFLVDFRVHSLSGLPTLDGTVELRLRNGDETLSCGTAYTFDGLVFLGAWTRFALDEASQDVTLEVLHAYNRSWVLIPPKPKVVSTRQVHLDCVAAVEQGDVWRDVDLTLEWLPTHRSEAVQKKVVEAVERLDEQQNPDASGKASGAGREEEQQQQDKQQQEKEVELADQATASMEAGGVTAAAAEQLVTERQRQQPGAAGEPPGAAAASAGGAAAAGEPAAAAAAAAAAEEANEAQGEPADVNEDHQVGATQLQLRFSYRVLPAAAADVPAQRGVPEVGDEPVEMPTTPLPRLAHCYAHGGFMGLAVSMLSDPGWRNILKEEDAESYMKVYSLYTRMLHKSKRPDKRLSALMTALENSPILCAYGLVRSGCTHPVGGGALPSLPSTPAASQPLSLVSGTIPEEGEEGEEEEEEEPSVQPSSVAAEAATATEDAAEAPEASGASGTAAEPAAAGAAVAEASGSRGLGEGEGAPGGAGPAAVTPPRAQHMSPGPGVGVSPRKSVPIWGASEAELHGVHITRSGRGSKRLETYLESLKRPNRYGYQPIGLEWDLWVHPKTPAALQHATVDHGTSGQLITQAITTAMPCLKPLAKRAGQKQILRYGISPVTWLNALGHSVNRAVHGDPSVPLPIPAERVEHMYRLHLTLMSVAGGAVCCSDLWDMLYARTIIDSADVVVPMVKTRALHVTPEGCMWNHEMQFWPLPLRLEKCDAVVEVRGDPAGIVRDKVVGMVRLPLRRLLKQHPQLAAGKHVELELPIGPKQQRHVHLGAAARPGATKAAAQSAVAEQRERREQQQQDAAAALAGEGAAALTAHAQRAKQVVKEKHKELAGKLQARLTSEEESEGETDEETDDEEWEAQQAEQAAGHAGGRGTLRVRLRLEEVSALAAAESIGVTPAAAQTCLAMLSKPGGLYLDVKSAYSTPRDLQLFVSTLKGIGVHCKAVCSFQKHQLQIGGLADTVQFFHGISGLENACDDGTLERGQFVLFNGASFLTDLKPANLKNLPAQKAKAELESSSDFPLDPFALRKYTGLCETYAIIGGIYVQEPDASPASVSALARLVAKMPEYFPLGFAYGHLSGHGVSFLDQNGRGFAAQQIVEEFQARAELSKKVMVRIKRGEHRQATLGTTIAWGQRLLYGSGMMGRAEQRTFIILLAQVWPYRHVSKVVDELGGIPRIFLRYFEHYELTTPLTLLEAGFNLNHTKDLIRLLRNRGVIAAMPIKDKEGLARFFCSRQLRGYGLTWALMLLGIRRGLHKFAKEGLVCVLESCTKEEYDQVVAALGGRSRVQGRLRGRAFLSWHYSQRLADVERVHERDPEERAYQDMDLRYSMLPVTSMRMDNAAGADKSTDPCHTREKSKRELAWRAVRKLTCCGFTCGYTSVLSIFTATLFLWCCVGPRVCGTAARGVLGISAGLAFLACAAAVTLLILFVPDEGILDPCKDPLTADAYPCCKSDYYGAHQGDCQSDMSFGSL